MGCFLSFLPREDYEENLSEEIQPQLIDFYTYYDNDHDFEFPIMYFLCD